MRLLTRGLFALIFLIFFQSHLFAEYLYKDEVIFNNKFKDEVELLGGELYTKTGVSLKLAIIRELPQDIEITKYATNLVTTFKQPTILIVFSEMNSQVDIVVNDSSLYKYFDKEQVLSPVASVVQAFLMASVYAKSFDEFKHMMSYTNGTILPLLGIKAKKGKTVNKYSVALFNGYLDIAQQVSKAKGVVLEHDFGNTNQKTLFYIKVFFYGFVLYAIFLYMKRRFYRKK